MQPQISSRGTAVHRIPVTSVPVEVLDQACKARDFYKRQTDKYFARLFASDSENHRLRMMLVSLGVDPSPQEK